MPDHLYLCFAIATTARPTGCRRILHVAGSGRVTRSVAEWVALRQIVPVVTRSHCRRRPSPLGSLWKQIDS